MRKPDITFYQFAGVLTVIMSGISMENLMIPIGVVRFFYMGVMAIVISRIIYYAGVEGVRNGAAVFTVSMEKFTGKVPEEVLEFIESGTEVHFSDNEKEVAVGAMHVWGKLCEARMHTMMSKILDEEIANAKVKNVSEQTSDKEAGGSGAYQRGHLYQERGSRGERRGYGPAGRS